TWQRASGSTPTAASPWAGASAAATSSSTPRRARSNCPSTSAGPWRRSRAWPPTAPARTGWPSRATPVPSPTRTASPGSRPDGSSHLVQAAVDGQARTGDEAALLRGQEGHGGGDLLRAPQPAQRHAPAQLPPEVVGPLRVGGQPRQAGSVDRAGRDGVDPDAALLELVGPGTRERAGGGLGRRVHAERLIAGLRVGGAVEDHRGSVVEQGQRLLDGEERAPGVDAEEGVEVLLGDLLKPGELGDRGVREQHVQAPAPVADRVVEPVQVVQVRDVAEHAGG